MKLTRKLIPAMIMLLVSAVLMSTASFAWFSINDTVTASGLKVTAIAPASLWIQQGSEAEGAFTGSGNRLTAISLANEMTGTKAQFTPVTPKDKTTANAWVFQKLDADSAQRVDISGKVNKPTYVDTANDHYKDTFQLYLAGEAGSKSATNVKAEVIWANESEVGEDRTTADPIYQALRVAVVSGSTVVILEPSELSKTGAAKYTAAQNFITLNADEAATVYVYIWIEGEDDQCKNANAYNLDSFQVNLVFGLGTAPVEPDPAEPTDPEGT